MPTAWIRPLALATTLWFVSACGALGASERFTPTARPILLPAGEGAHVLFDGGRVSKVVGAEEEWSLASESTAPRPSAAGFDLASSGWACVGYADRLAFLQLGAKRVRWAPSPSQGLHRSIAVRDELAAVNDGRVVHLVEVPSGERLERLDAGSFLKQLGQDEIDHAEPLSDAELLLITSRSVGAMTDGRTIALRVERAPAGWTIQHQNRLPSLTWADQCVSSGGKLYVAGIFESSNPSADRRRIELRQQLSVVAIDTQTLRITELVRLDHVPPTVVRGVAVGVDELAVLLAPGEVRIFALADGRELRRQNYARADAIAWVGPKRWVVRAGDASVTLTY